MQHLSTGPGVQKRNVQLPLRCFPRPAWGRLALYLRARSFDTKPGGTTRDPKLHHPVLADRRSERKRPANIQEVWGWE